MKRKNFRLGLAALIGLVCYFLALSALLFGSVGMPGDSGFGTGAGKTPHGHGNLPKDLAANPPPRGKFHQRGSGTGPADGAAGTEGDPCLIAQATCNAAGIDLVTDGAPAWTNPRDTIVTGGNGGPFDGRNLLYPVSSGPPLFGGGVAGGPPGVIGENGGPSQNDPGGTDGPTGGTPPGSTGPDPGNAPPPVQPGNGPPLISQFLPNSPPGPGIPDPPGDTPQFVPTDPPIPSDPPGKPVPVPEPSSFWLLGVSLAIILPALRRTTRAGRIR